MKRTAFAIAFTTVFLITLLLVASAPSLKAASEALQLQWSKKYGLYNGRSVIQTTDGGYAIAVETAVYEFRGYSGYTPLLINTDSSGELEWKNT